MSAPPPPPPPAAPALAPLGLRAVARGLDLALFLWLTTTLWVEVFRRFAPSPQQGATLGDVVSAQQWSLRLLALGVSFALEVVPVAVWGRDLGKALLGLKVVRVDGGDVPGLVRSFGRWLVFVAPLLLGLVGVPIFLVVVGWSLFDRDRQGLHDKVAGTVVLAVGRPGSGAAEASGA